MDKQASIYVAGHRGLSGSAIVRALRERGHERIVTASRSELDLRDGRAVDAFFAEHRPDYVFLCAATVGGIVANQTQPVRFIRDNLLIQTNVLEAAASATVEKLLFLGSSCIYPRLAPQPLREEYLLTGPLEPTNQAYAVAKIAGVTLCRAYNSEQGASFLPVMPPNLFGPNDNFDPATAHVVQGLISRMFRAKLDGEGRFLIWGSGEPRREYLYVDDLADAALFLMDSDETELINVGVGSDLSVREIAQKVAAVVGYEGELVFDTGKPDGVPQKLLDVTRLTELGWTPRHSFEDGLDKTHAWFREHVAPHIARGRASADRGPSPATSSTGPATPR